MPHHDTQTNATDKKPPHTRDLTVTLPKLYGKPELGFS